MTSVPGVDHPAELSEADITPVLRGITVSSLVESFEGGVIVVRPSVGEIVNQVVVNDGDMVEVFWSGPGHHRALMAEVVEIDPGSAVRWWFADHEPGGAEPATQGGPCPRDPAGGGPERGRRPDRGDDRSQRGRHACDARRLGPASGPWAADGDHTGARRRRSPDEGGGGPAPGARCAVADLHQVRRHRREGPGPRPPARLPGASRGTDARRGLITSPTSAGSDGAAGAEMSSARSAHGRRAPARRTCDDAAPPAARRPRGAAGPAVDDAAPTGHARSGHRRAGSPRRLRPDRRLPAPPTG